MGSLVCREPTNRNESPQDLKSLAQTVREIADMDVDEGRALGVRPFRHPTLTEYIHTDDEFMRQDDGPRLRSSLWSLAQLEDIPFRDEYQLRGWARRLLKAWPAA